MKQVGKRRISFCLFNNPKAPNREKAIHQKHNFCSLEIGNPKNRVLQFWAFVILETGFENLDDSGDLMVTFNGSLSAWIHHLLACMGGCFGCCTKPTPIIAVDEPSKGLKIQGRTVKKPGLSDDFWSSSTYDLDNSALQSQRSLSSISTLHQTLLQGSSIGSTSSQPDFVNQGLVLWNQTRLEWTGSGKPKNESLRSRESRLSWNSTYERLVGPKQRQPFPQRVPLSEMIEFLVEVWEQEGLYD